MAIDYSPDQVLLRVEPGKILLRTLLERSADNETPLGEAGRRHIPIGVS